jgi:hypothetical protein
MVTSDGARVGVIAVSRADGDGFITSEGTMVGFNERAKDGITEGTFVGI